MPDPRQITDLPVAPSAEDVDLMLLRQGATDQQVTVTNVRAPLLRKSANLSDVASASAARTNLDVPQISATLLKAGNLAGLANAVTARTNLGLGTAAVKNTGTGTGAIPLAEDVDGLVVRGFETFSATDTFTVPEVPRIFFAIQNAGGGGGGGGGSGGLNDGADGSAGGTSYIQDDSTSDVIAGTDVGSGGGGGKGGKDDGTGGRGGLGSGGYGQHGAPGVTAVTGAFGGWGAQGPTFAFPADDVEQSWGGNGGLGGSGAGGGGGGALGRFFTGFIDTSTLQGDLWNIVVGSGGAGGAQGTGGYGGGGDGTSGADGFIVLWW